jgi:hypothetical protein
LCLARSATSGPPRALNWNSHGQMSAPSDEVKRNWNGIFASLWTAVLEDSQLRKPPPSLEMVFSGRLPAGAAPSLASVEPFVITVSTRFAMSLHSEIRSLSDQFALLAFDSAPSSRVRARRALEVFEAFTVTFIILHEMFHLVAGHAGWVNRRSRSLSFAQGQMGLPLSYAASQSYAPTAKAYLLESEADCSAIQWMCQVLMPVSLQRLLGTHITNIQFFSGEHRVIAFRILLASVWLAIRRLESAREELMRNNSKTHPLPTTRVFGAFGTLLMHYSRISNVRYDADGGAQHRLSGADVAAIQTFLKRVLGPVLKCDWNPKSAVLPPESLEAQMRFYLHDWANHLQNRPVKTVVGRELIRMERERFRMHESLAPFRYYIAAELNDSSKKASTKGPKR